MGHPRRAEYVSDTIRIMIEKAERAEQALWEKSTQVHDGGNKYVFRRKGKGEFVYLNVLAPSAHPDTLIATFFANHLSTEDGKNQLLSRRELCDLLGELLALGGTEHRSTLCVPAYNEEINTLILRSGGHLSASGPFPGQSLDISFDNLRSLHQRLGGKI